MKLGKQTHSVVLDGVESSQRQFTVKASAKLARILSDGLYSDKVFAIIRELSCNAYDSHVAAGKKEVPFQIHFPTLFEPYFSVQDFGVGLSETDIFEVYTKYFESTKEDSNDFIGALGLGSKSPFAYVKTFTVTSIKDGKKGIYSAFIDEEGFPSIVLMQAEDTEESNGVKVEFPVKSADISEFHYKGANVLEFFDPKPIVNKLQYEIPKENYKYTGKSEDGCFWKIKAFKSPSRVIMGNIAYPVDFQMGGQTFSEKFKLIQDYGFDIEFKIGELEVAASREKLSYNKYTLANMEKRFNMVFDHFEKEVLQRLDSMTTLWEVVTCLNVMMNENTPAKYILNKKDIKKYKDFEIPEGRKFKIDGLEYHNISIYGVYVGGGQFVKRTLLSIPEVDYETYKKTLEDAKSKDKQVADKANRHIKYVESSYKFNVAPQKGSTVYLADERRGFMDVLRYFSAKDTKNQRYCILIVPKNKVSEEDINKDIKKLQKALGNPEIVKISDIDDRPESYFEDKKTKRISIKKDNVSKLNLMHYDPKFSRAWTRYLIETTQQELDSDELKLYFKTKRNAAVVNKDKSPDLYKRFGLTEEEDKLDLNDFHDIYRIGIDLGIIKYTTPVFAIRREEALEMDNTWEDFFVFLERKLREYLLAIKDDDNIKTRYYMQNMSRSIESNLQCGFVSSIKYNLSTKKISNCDDIEIVRLIVEREKIRNAVESAKAEIKLNTLNRALNYGAFNYIGSITNYLPVKVKCELRDIDEKIVEELKKYPMLLYISNYCDMKVMSDCFDYIRAINKP